MTAILVTINLIISIVGLIVAIYNFKGTSRIEKKVNLLVGEQNKCQQEK